MKVFHACIIFHNSIFMWIRSVTYYFNCNKLYYIMDVFFPLCECNCVSLVVCEEACDDEAVVICF